MATGMQTGRRTGSMLRTGASTAGESGGGGFLAGIRNFWNGIDPKKKTIIIVSAALMIIMIIVINLVLSSNRPVPLYAGSITPGDASAIQQKLLTWGVPCSIGEGGSNVMIHPRYKSRALLQLAQEGLPRTPVLTTTDFLTQKSGGMVPDTKEDKERKFNKAVEGDLTEALRQMVGVADAKVTIVPQPDTSWGPSEDKASAAIMLRLQPGTKLSKRQVNAIVHYVTMSVKGLDGDRVKVVDTSGNTLNDRLSGATAMAGDEESGDSMVNQERKSLEKELREKVQSSLNTFLGSDRYDVQVNVEMDPTQSETNIKKYGGPANTKGSIETGKSEKVETYNSDPGSSKGEFTEMSGTSGTNSNYLKKESTVRTAVDEKTIHTVRTAAQIKRLTASVMVDGVKDKEMLARLETHVQNAIGYDASRGDTVTVVPFPKTNVELLKDMSENAAAAPGWASDRRTSQMPSWLPAAMAIPVVLLVMLIALFYMKQKSVQREKQRLVLTTGPGATVSDISDLLADKEGKITPPPATRVNTTDQLENLAKEKPTKVAELLKSTWLADR